MGFRIIVALITLLANISLLGQDSTVVKVFDENIILFGYVEQDGITISENGQTISRKVELPKFPLNCEIFAKVEIEKNLENGDPWDRAGTILLSNGIDPDIEILKFMTGYAVPTKHRLKVSDLCSLLQGEVEIKAHIPSNPEFIGFKINFELVYYEKENIKDADWAKGVFFNNSLEKKHIDNYLTSTTVNIPAGLKQVNLNYYTSGHCTDGRGADEFESKDNVIYIDDEEVYRFQPWRDDCENFPSNGTYWYSRSGWCPGDIVEPLVLDLSEYLTPGEHKIEFIIEDIRGIDANNNYGYWKVSSFLTGFLGEENPDVLKIKMEPHSKKIIPVGSIVDLDISFVDENENLVVSNDQNLSIEADKSGLSFSDNGTNWNSSLNFDLSIQKKLHIKAENSDVYKIKTVNSSNGMENSLELIALENIAQYSTVWGSDSSSFAEAPKYAVDGDFSTKWSDNSRKFPNTLELTFNEAKEVNYLAIYHAGSGGEAPIFNTIDYQIDYLDQNSEWQKIIDLEDNYDTREGNITTHLLENTITTRAIKLQIMYPEAAGNVARIYEFQIFNLTEEHIDKLTQVHLTQELPSEFKLGQNYPNPFNPITIMNYSITSNMKSEKSNVQLIVYDVLGRKIKTLVDEYKQPGNYSINFDATNLNSGVYFYQLKSGYYQVTKKMMLMK